MNSATANGRERHEWRFFRAGGLDQVLLETGADLACLQELDLQLWTALACPVRGLEFDARTLEFIDCDGDGRIRVPEVLAAVRWAVSLLRDPEVLVKNGSGLPVAAIRDDSSEAQQVAIAARQVLQSLGKQHAATLTVEDVVEGWQRFIMEPLNGDGVVPPDAAPEPAVRRLMEEIVDCVGGVADRSGKMGVSAAKVEEFFAEALAFADWRKRGESDSKIWVWGDRTHEAAAAFRSVRDKVEDYFARCRLAAFDPRVVPLLNRSESDYRVVVDRYVQDAAADLAAFPLARVEPGRPLPLESGLNPAWESAMARFRTEVVTPLLGAREALHESDWRKLCSTLAPFEQWLASKGGSRVEKLGWDRICALLEGPERHAVLELVARDQSREPAARSMLALEKLVRFQRDLHHFLNHFVSFRDFYLGRDRALFQVGTLYLDQRACDLCLRVEDPTKHASLAGMSGMYLMYCDCARPATGERMQIVAVVTDGDADNLMVGRNGVFFDRKGRDWDATVTRIVDNPISLRQAFWSPYKKLVRFMEEQAAKRAAAAQAASNSKLEASAAAVVTPDKTKPPETKRMDTGTVAALGVGVGAIATVLGGFVSGFLGLRWWQMLLALAGLCLAISGPSVFIAWLKLRKRNLGPLLDANGWAINARARLGPRYAKTMTRLGVLPPGASRTVIESGAARTWMWIAGLLVAGSLGLGAWLYASGLMHHWSGGRWGRPVPGMPFMQAPPDAKQSDATSPP
ncbi:MAG: hypothetical protein RMN51_13000 [Verrucomicrobiota bacterium]|nr:hypothetical protein [Limisphaera sp.]MDW8383012.1 hypothetical protein [Verrucomicrobiota bacterium]